MSAITRAEGLTQLFSLKEIFLGNITSLIKGIYNCSKTLNFSINYKAGGTDLSDGQQKTYNYRFKHIIKIDTDAKITEFSINAESPGYKHTVNLNLETNSFPSHSAECKINEKEIEKRGYLSNRNKLEVKIESAMGEMERIGRVKTKHVRLENGSYQPCNRDFTDLLQGFIPGKYKKSLTDVKIIYSTTQKEEILSILRNQIKNYYDEISVLNFKLKKVNRDIYTYRQNLQSIK
ncbi:hypothetical protein [Winslowiella arboricola]|uniref:hypothetical protein n=1 Tax=Winslowiella arboricola TaxID=2978220 RepID=UPI00225E023C|nr:hypothetical protein [Winslowiella arboricola]MCU5772427.1 hypothetical protein [Winslowiella arboricola]